MSTAVIHSIRGRGRNILCSIFFPRKLASKFNVTASKDLEAPRRAPDLEMTRSAVQFQIELFVLFIITKQKHANDYK